MPIVAMFTSVSAIAPDQRTTERNKITADFAFTRYWWRVPVALFIPCWQIPVCSVRLTWLVTIEQKNTLPGGIFYSGALPELERYCAHGDMKG
jgi:hypothetical protein